MLVRLLNTIGGSTAQKGDIIEVDEARGRDLIAGWDAVDARETRTPVSTDPDAKFVRAQEGDGETVDKTALLPPEAPADPS
jgi:hypothetical protein